MNFLGKDALGRDGGKAALDAAASPSVDPELIERLYDTSADPTHFDALLEVWEHALWDYAAPAPGGLPVFRDEIDRHFSRAGAIMARIGRSMPEDARAQAAADPRPALLIAADGSITFTNEAAQKELGAREGANAADLPLEADAVTIMRAALRRLNEQKHARVSCILAGRSVPAGRRILLSLSRVESPLAVARLLTVDVTWNRELAAHIAQAFALTRAELDVAHAFISGETLIELARRKARSIDTVRSQAKSLLRKAGLHSQLELVRLFAGYAGFTPEPGEALAGESRTDRISLRDGRRLCVTRMGAEGGKPVILLHGMLSGVTMTARAEGAFAASGYSVIAPWRPGFGESDPQGGDAAGYAQRFAADLCEMMDQLGLRAAPVIGHMSGSICAMAAAAALPKRFTHVLLVAGALPFTTTGQIGQMTARQRVIAYTARFAPRIFPMIVRAGISQVDSAGGLQRLIAALYRHSPPDAALINDPEVHFIVERAIRQSVAQGPDAFVVDGLTAPTDWSAAFLAAKVPVRILHGDNDPAMPFSVVSQFAARWQVPLSVATGAGQLLMHGLPERVVSELDKLCASHRSA